MSKLLVFGHQNPDTDAITSAISYAFLLRQLGEDAEAVALGTPNEETQYALNYFKKEAPRVIGDVSQETNRVALVDHNEVQQSATGVEKVEVEFVVDHHRIANFQTANPLFYHAEPVGCTNTILYKMYKEYGVEVPKDIAGLMVSAIVSDTLLFKSPTCTQQDILEMIKAGTNLGYKSEAELIDLDAKSFPMGGANLRIAQVNVVDPEELLARREALEESMRDANSENGYDTFVFVITNILTSVSTVLVVGDYKDKVAQAFNSNYTDGLLTLPGVVSRKKQVVPPLTVAFEG